MSPVLGAWIAPDYRTVWALPSDMHVTCRPLYTSGECATAPGSDPASLARLQELVSLIREVTHSSPSVSAKIAAVTPACLPPSAAQVLQVISLNGCPFN